MLPYTFSGTLDCQILIAQDAAANFPHCLGGSLCVTAVTQSRDWSFTINLNVLNISQIKHTWFSLDFLFVTDLSNYNAVVLTGKKACENGRRTGIHSEHKKGITEPSI